MKYIHSLSIFSVLLLGCQATSEAKIDSEPDVVITKPTIEGATQLRSPITYEGIKFTSYTTQTTEVLDSDSLYKTIIDISNNVGIETTIELQYYLQEGEYFSGPDSYGQDTLIGSITFHEKLEGDNDLYTSSYTTEDAYGSIEVFDFNGETWSIKFGGGDGTISDFENGTELSKYYRCAGGTITNLFLSVPE